MNLPRSLIERAPQNAREEISVMFTPIWPKNPYHVQLISELNDNNIVVVPDVSLKQFFRDIKRGTRTADIVHLHAIPRFRATPNMLLRLALLVSRIKRLKRANIRFVLTVHDLLPHETNSPKIDYLIGQRMGALMDRLFVHSTSALKSVRLNWNISDDKIKVIPHANFIDCYKNQISQREARHSLGLKEDALVYLFLGQIRKYKGIDELLRAFSSLDAPNSVLLLAGEPWTPATKDSLHRMAERDDRICLKLDFVPPDEIQTYMNASDIVVFPYHRACTSGAAILAMSFAKPCVATNVDAFPDLLDSRGAFFCQPNDDVSLAKALAAAAAAREQLPRMGLHNYNLVKQWGWADMARELAQHYNFLAGS